MTDKTDYFTPCACARGNYLFYIIVRYQHSSEGIYNLCVHEWREELVALNALYSPTCISGFYPGWSSVVVKALAKT